MKFRHQFQKDYLGVYAMNKGEINDMEPLVVPDDSLSLRQLMINHTRGIPSPGGSYREGIYTGDTLVPTETRQIDRAEAIKRVLVKGEDLTEQVQEEQEELKKQKRNEKKSKEAQKSTGKATDGSKEEEGTQPSGD